jgi:hypothetical protein
VSEGKKGGWCMKIKLWRGWPSSEIGILLFLHQLRGLETGSNKIRTCALPNGSNIELAYQHRDMKKQKVIDF